MNRLAPYWKAVVGFVSPGAVIIGSSVLAGSDGGTRITTAEWVTAVVAMIVTGGAVLGKSNAPVLSSRRPTFLKGNQRGAGEVDLLVRVVALVIVVLLVIWLVRVLLHA